LLDWKQRRHVLGFRSLGLKGGECQARHLLTRATRCWKRSSFSKSSEQSDNNLICRENPLRYLAGSSSILFFFFFSPSTYIAGTDVIVGVDTFLYEFPFQFLLSLFLIEEEISLKSPFFALTATEPSYSKR
jgi:hypothetical protein